MLKAALALLALVLASSCAAKSAGMAAYKDKLYLMKNDIVYMCETDKTGLNMICQATTGAP